MRWTWRRWGRSTPFSPATCFAGAHPSFCFVAVSFFFERQRGGGVSLAPPKSHLAAKAVVMRAVLVDYRNQCINRAFNVVRVCLMFDLHPCAAPCSLLLTKHKRQASQTPIISARPARAGHAWRGGGAGVALLVAQGVHPPLGKRDQDRHRLERSAAVAAPAASTLVVNRAVLSVFPKSSGACSARHMPMKNKADIVLTGPAEHFSFPAQGRS